MVTTVLGMAAPACSLKGIWTSCMAAHGSQRVFQETGSGSCLGLETGSASPPPIFVDQKATEPTQIQGDPTSQWEK